LGRAVHEPPLHINCSFDKLINARIVDEFARKNAIVVFGYNVAAYTLVTFEFTFYGFL
jgi:hypothetical protein